MAFNPLTKIFGSRNDRLLKTYRKTIERINALEARAMSASFAREGELSMAWLKLTA